MIIYLNDLAINSGSNGYYLDEDVEGLDLPEIRTSSGVLSGRDGGYVGAQFYGNRQISLNGTAFSSDIATMESLRRTLQEAVATKAVIMRIVTNGGNAYMLYCNLLRFKMPIKRALTNAPFKIDLIAADPIIYDDTASGALTATVARASSDGFTWPITWPITWPPGVGPTTVTNGGNTTVYPFLTLTGSMTNPTITNTTTGKVFELANLTTGSSDVVVVDMRARTVTLNGGSIFTKVTDDSAWFGLVPGANSILLETGSGSDTVSATVSWRSGYVGI